jgi:hypothetical protein
VSLRRQFAHSHVVHGSAFLTPSNRERLKSEYRESTGKQLRAIGEFIVAAVVAVRFDQAPGSG